jgi:protein-disulfide isomerase
MRRSKVLAAAALLTTSCWTAPQPEFEEAPPALPHMDAKNEPANAAPDAPVRALAGVDTNGLDEPQKRQWWKLVSQLYSPCTEQAVGLVQCIDEARDCAACTPMAQFIADKIKKGLSNTAAEAAAAIRFGPDVTKVERRSSPSVGPEDAPITMVVWTDFECPHCKAAVPILEKFQKEHAKTVRLVHKFYPLIHKHVNAKNAALAAVAAQKQGKFWEMHHTLFDNQERLEQQDLERYAKQVGLDMGKYEADVAAPATETVVDTDMADADAAGLHATPFILINGRHFDQDYFRYSELEDWVALELRLQAAQKKE